MQDLWIISSFLIFPHEVRHHAVNKLTDPGLWKKIQIGLQGSKNPKNEGFMGFSKNLIYSDIYDFLLRYEIFNSLLTFCKNNMFGKNLDL